LYKDSVLEGGHAEIENNNILYLYGNSFEVMLPDPSFQNSIETVHQDYKKLIFRYILNLQSLKSSLNQNIWAT